MEYTAETAVAMSLDVFRDSDPSAAAWDIITNVGTHFPPNEFLPFVPKHVVEALQMQVKELPRRPEDLLFISSAVYNAKFFEGLTDEQIQVKFEHQKCQRRQEVFDSMHRLYVYFHERAV